MHAIQRILPRRLAGIQQPLFMPYWENRAQVAVADDLLLYDERIVIPQALRLAILYGTKYMVQQPHSSSFFA